MFLSFCLPSSPKPIKIYFKKILGKQARYWLLKGSPQHVTPDIGMSAQGGRPSRYIRCQHSSHPLGAGASARATCTPSSGTSQPPLPFRLELFPFPLQRMCLGVRHVLRGDNGQRWCFHGRWHCGPEDRSVTGKTWGREGKARGGGRGRTPQSGHTPVWPPHAQSEHILKGTFPSLPVLTLHFKAGECSQIPCCHVHFLP